ncbi:MAG: TerB family tellurite resistance protein [SAR324 cluster bacterium]|nr:TerB family tellurite resistance protein [SAR324 cluster bacterium]
MISKILERLSQGDDKKIKQWVVKIIIGAIIADKVIHKSEIPFLVDLFESLKDDPETLPIFFNRLREFKTYPIEPLDKKPTNAEEIFSTILKICRSDNQFHADEIKYCHTVGSIMGLSPMIIGRMIKETDASAKHQAFFELLQGLNKEERFWMAEIIMKIIKADGKVDQKEIPYLSHLYDLLDGSSEKMKEIEQHSENLDLENLQPMNFDKSRSREIITHVIEISMCDRHLDQRELDFILSISDKINFPHEDVATIVEMVRAATGIMPLR